MSEKDECSNCQFWKEGSYPSECLRHAPTIIRPNSIYAQWPLTRGTDWCGDYKLKPGAKRKLLGRNYRVLSIPLFGLGVLQIKRAKHTSYYETYPEFADRRATMAVFGLRFTVMGMLPYAVTLIGIFVGVFVGVVVGLLLPRGIPYATAWAAAASFCATGGFLLAVLSPKQAKDIE